MSGFGGAAGGRDTLVKSVIVQARVQARRAAPRNRRALTTRLKAKRRFSVAFEQFLELLHEFVSRKGHAAVLYSETVGNFALGHRATYYRGRYRRGFLSPEQVRVLEDDRRFPGWAWHPLDGRFAQGIRHLERFVEREGHARVPVNHVELGFRLGSWVAHRRHERRAGRLPEAQVLRLWRIHGWTWQPGSEPFVEGLLRLRAFVAREGHSRVPAQHTEDGFRLGTWVSRRRADYREGRLGPARAKRLERLPAWTWDVRGEEFERAYSLLLRFVHRVGHARVPQRHVERGFPLGAWVARVRLRRRGAANGRLSARQVLSLESLPGWTWGRSRGR